MDDFAFMAGIAAADDDDFDERDVFCSRLR